MTEEEKERLFAEIRLLRTAAQHQQASIETQAATIDAFFRVFQCFAVALHASKALKRDEIAIALEGAKEWVRREKAHPSALEAVEIFQRALLLEIDGKPDGRPN